MKYAIAKGWPLPAGALLLATLGYGYLGAQPPPAPKGAAFGRFETVQGTVADVTTAPKGEVDGVTLRNGSWLHWPPHMADQFSDVVRKGDRVRALGRWETGPKGDTKLEVSTVTNLRTGKVAVNEDLPAPASVAGAPAARQRRAAPPVVGGSTGRPDPRGPAYRAGPVRRRGVQQTSEVFRTSEVVGTNPPLRRGSPPTPRLTRRARP